MFTVDASVLTAVGGIDNLEAFRDNAVIQPCSQADGTANPDPCVAGRTVDPGTGDGKITILSTHASKWNLGKSTLAPYAFDGYKAPIRPGLNKLNPGSEQPMQFRLGGNLGLGILASGYPLIQPIDCTTLLPTGSSFGARGTLSYDRKADTYTYTWKSPKVLPQCVELNVKTLDGVSHPALFKTH